MAVVEIDFAHRSSSFPRPAVGARAKKQPSRPATQRIVHAHSDDGLLTWSYTAGLREAAGHPEFLLTGLDPFLSESVLTQLSESVAKGQTYDESIAQKDLLHRLTCAFREVPQSMANVLMPMAKKIIHGQGLCALQCIYPDNHNRLPWHFGYNASWHEVQPLFTSQMPLTKVEITLLRAAAGISRSSAQHRTAHTY